MGTPDQRQLGYIWLNRQLGRGVEAIGGAAARCLEAGWLGDVEHREAVRVCVGHVVDGVFREYCTLGKVDRRSVEICVCQAGAVDSLRRRWLVELVGEFDRQCRFSGSPRVVFHYGHDGDRFEQPGEGAVGGMISRQGTKASQEKAR